MTELEIELTQALGTLLRQTARPERSDAVHPAVIAARREAARVFQKSQAQMEREGRTVSA